MSFFICRHLLLRSAAAIITSDVAKPSLNTADSICIIFCKVITSTSQPIVIAYIAATFSTRRIMPSL